MKFGFATRFIVLASKKGGIVKKGIIPVFLILFAAMVLAVSCEKVEEVLGITISGTVTNGGQPVVGAIVLVFNDNQIDSGTSIDIDTENINGSITGNEGRYTIIRVEDGTYYLVAIKDENGNKSYDLGVDPIGWYGHDSFGIIIPDPVVVSGEDKSGIDIDTMYAQ